MFVRDVLIGIIGVELGTNCLFYLRIRKDDKYEYITKYKNK